MKNQIKNLLLTNEIDVVIDHIKNKGCIANYGYRHLATKDCSWIYDDCSYCYRKVIEEISQTVKKVCKCENI